MTLKFTRLCFLQTLAVLTATILAPAVCFAETNPAPAPAKAAKKTVRLLTVGNSFSGNATEYLSKIAQAAGNVLVQRSASIGGATMAKHWEKVEQNERDPQDPAGLYGKRSLKEELQAEPWDIVTIQQASLVSHDLAAYRPYAVQLRDYIKKFAPKAEVVVHQTWAYRRDDPRFTKPLPGIPETQQAMHEELTKSYDTIAAELGARIIPSGDAFNLANTDPAWGYQPDTKFEFKSAQPPTLPDQTHSLNVGWQWKKGTDGNTTLTMDGHHASPAGKYLAACVWYEFLFNGSVVGNSFLPKEVTAEEAQYLQKTAHRAVENRREKKAL